MSQPNDESGPGAGPANPYGPGYTNPYGTGSPNPYGPGYTHPYGTGYTFSTPPPPPPPRRRRRAAVLVALSLIAAFVVGVAGAELGRYATTADTVPTRGATQPSSGTTADPSAAPSASSTPPASPATTGDPSSIAAVIDPALVDIVSTFSYQQASGAGTGIVLSASGEVLTNNHVIAGATSISVTDVGNGQTYTASVVGYDAAHDVAVLQLQGASGLQVASISTAAAAVGDAVVAVGNAGGVGGTPIAAAGSVRALGQSISASNELTGTSERLSDLIEVDANIQAGDSGGALVDRGGAVVGINTAGSSSYAMSAVAGRGFAIPVADAMAIVSAVEAGKGSTTTHVGESAFLGVLMGTARVGRGQTTAMGALVGGVVSGDPAARAGIVAGDTITSLGGQPVDSATTLGQLMIGYHPGSTVRISWLDAAGADHVATVTLVSGPPA